MSDGVVTMKANPGQRVTYGELIGGNRFNVTLTGNDINATTGIAKIKPVTEMKNVGLSPHRDDIPAKVDASPIWAVGKKVPGMLHARNVKPPVAGAEVVSVDESSVSGMPGFVKVVRERNYVAVVFQREEQAIAAARRLKVNWRKPAAAPFPASEELFTFMRRAKPTSSESNRHRKYRDGARRRGHTHRGRYEVPFQGHTSIGPAHALADPSNGQMTIYSNDMKSYGLRSGVAEFLNIPRDRIRVIWMQGPQASVARPPTMRVSKRPIWRTSWASPCGCSGPGTKPPGTRKALRMSCGCAVDSTRRESLVALDYEARAADYCHLGYNEHDTVLIAQLTGRRRQMPAAGGVASPSDMRGAKPARRATWSRCRSCGKRR